MPSCCYEDSTYLQLLLLLTRLLSWFCTVWYCWPFLPEVFTGTKTCLFLGCRPKTYYSAAPPWETLLHFFSSPLNKLFILSSRTLSLLSLFSLICSLIASYRLCYAFYLDVSRIDYCDWESDWPWLFWVLRPWTTFVVAVDVYFLRTESTENLYTLSNWLFIWWYVLSNFLVSLTGLNEHSFIF